MKLNHAFFGFLLCPLQLLSVQSIYGQNPSRYPLEKELPGPEFHQSRRDLLREKLPENSCAVIFAYPQKSRSLDTDYSFHQNPDLYYLTGFREPNCMLVIYKEARSILGLNSHEILFIEPRDLSKEIWNGRRSGTEEAETNAGIERVLTHETLFSSGELFTGLDKILYVALPKGMENDRHNPYDLFDLVEYFKKTTGFPSGQHDDFLLGKMMRSMREIKTSEELALMKKAVSISMDAHLEMMQALSPGMTEFQVQAVGEYIFRMQGAAGPAYPSICGAAENSCVLHYHDNGRLLNQGDLILLDMGAEYLGYAADITRTLPVSGQFTVIQKKIYDLVLSAQRAAIAQCKPGNHFNDPDKAARKVLREGLIRLGILGETGDLSTFFPHGTSHYLGLDVHDTGTPAVLKPGMILTVEPGLYFPENSNCDPAYWNIGIRIEDDILITEDGHQNLSGNLPVETADIEQVMQSPSLFMPFQPKK